MKNFKRHTFRKWITVSLGLTLALSTGLSIIPATATTASAATSVTGKQIISTGAKYLGVKYKFGGKTPPGFDCQGFTRYVYGKYGIDLPSGARGQSQVGKYVSRNNLQPGDLVFFSTTATVKYSSSSIKRIGHVGIYAGNGKILHTYGEGGVKYNDLDSKWWSSHYVTARRVLDQSNQTSTGTLSLTSQAKRDLALLQGLLKDQGYKTYSNVNDWLQKGTTINPSSMKRGDIALFSMKGSKSSIDHAAVYLGNGQLLYKTNSTTQYYSVDSPYVKNHFVTIKRAK